MGKLPAVIGLGANLGDRTGTLRAAAAALARFGPETARSPLYESTPVGPDQPDFLNAVILVSSEWEPEALVTGLLDIEASLGRIRRERWGPRTIDLDLLILGDRTLSTPTVTLPHPEIARRAFVLQPWSDVAPDMIVPGLGTVSEVLARLPAETRRQVWLYSRDW